MDSIQLFQQDTKDEEDETRDKTTSYYAALRAKSAATLTPKRKSVSDTLPESNRMPDVRLPALSPRICLGTTPQQWW
jgi:hypothetical protein